VCDNVRGPILGLDARVKLGFVFGPGRERVVWLGPKIGFYLIRCVTRGTDCGIDRGIGYGLGLCVHW
jgi:hypothetical protein